MTADFPIPAGYALVPLEPTLAMIEAAKDERMACFKDTSLSVGAALTRIYTAALAAAPPIAAVVGEPVAPIDMVLHCPECGTQHIDAPEEEEYEDRSGQLRMKCDWTNPPHRSHMCHACEHVWRPANIPTNGVAAVRTKGKADSPIVAPSPATDSAAVVGVEANVSEVETLRFLLRECINMLEAKETERKMPKRERYLGNSATYVANIVARCRSALATSQALPVAAGEAVAQIEIAALGNTINSASWKMFKAGYELPPGIYPLYAGSPPTAREPLSQKWINTLANQNGWDGVDGAPAWMTELVRDVESAHEIVAAPTGGDRG